MVSIFNTVMATESILTLSVEQMLELVSTSNISNAETTSQKNLVYRVRKQETHLPSKYNTDGTRNKEYDNYKKTLPCVLWAGKKATRTGSIEKSNYIYFDIDGITNLDEVKEIVTGFPFVKALWKSVSKTGFGGIIAVNDTDDIKLTYAKIVQYFQDNNVTIDPAVKDIYSRLNVISLDKDCFINKNVVPFDESSVVLVAKPKKVKEVVEQSAKTNEDFQSYLDSDDSIEFVSGMWHTSLVKCFTKANLYGISIEGAIATVEATFNIELNKSDLYQVNDIYNRYEESFGMWRCHSIDIGCGTSFTLSSNQYLTDITNNIDITKNFKLVSPVGSGKSFWVSTLNIKKIIIVPTTVLVKEFSSKYSFTPFYEDEKVISDSIVCTYSSLESLVERLGKKVSEYTLFFDEAHNISLSTSDNFLLKPITSIYKHLESFKNFILMTGTPVLDLHPITKDLPVITVTKENNTKYSINILTYNVKGQNTALLKTIKENKAKNVLTTILLNNKGEKLDTIKKLVSKDYKVVIINADEKANSDFKAVTVEGKVSDDTDVIISTVVLKEGTSITEYVKKDINVIVMGNFHYTEIQQFANRFRNADTIKVTKLITKDLLDTQNWTPKPFNSNFHINLAVKGATDSLKRYCDTLEIYKEYTDLDVSFKILKIEKQFTSRNFIDPNRMEINYLAVNNYIIEKETNYINLNIRILLEKMRDLYGYEIDKNNNIVEAKREIVEQEEVINKIRKEAKINEKEEAIAIFTACNVYDITSHSESHNKSLAHLVYMFIRVNRYVGFETAKRLVLEVAFDTRLEKSLLHHFQWKYVYTYFDKNDVYSKLLKALRRRIMEETKAKYKRITPEQLRAEVNCSFKKLGIEVTANEAVELIGGLFKLERISNKIYKINYDEKAFVYTDKIKKEANLDIQIIEENNIFKGLSK